MTQDMIQRENMAAAPHAAKAGHTGAGGRHPGGSRPEPALRPAHQHILEAFRAYGPMVPDELADRIGRSVLYVRPRCSELRAMGLLRATGESRRNPTSGLSAVVLALAT